MKVFNNRKFRFCIKAIIFITPFIMGTIGYLMAGVGRLQALYSAVCLYFLNYNMVEWNWLLEISRWLAPLCTASGILMLMKRAAEGIKGFLLRMTRKAVVVYCEENIKPILKKNIKNIVFASQDNIYTGVKDNIIMLSSDLDSLNFYYKNEKKFEKSNVYLRLEQMDSFLLKENSIKFFNETELIARNYWKECNLLKYMKDDGMKAKIAIIGFGQLGQKLLSYGLMNNIYALNQEIEYHVWGQSAAYEQMFSQFDLMNEDKVTYHGEDWAKDLKGFADFDRIIVTQEQNLELLQALLYVCSDTEIDYYNKGEAELEKVFAGENLRSFGTQEKILTQQNVMSEDLYRLGMELNYSYSNNYDPAADYDMNKMAEIIELWNKLDGFLKASNLASADYHEIRLMILKAQGKNEAVFSEEEKETLSEAEHIRWSRFYFLNHWKYGELEEERKDAKRRIHTYLVPYAKLTRKVQEMDWNTIERLLQFKGL